MIWHIRASRLFPSMQLGQRSV